MPDVNALLFVPDVHLSDTPPGWRREGYREQILDKLAWCAQVASKENAAMMLVGDIFHHRRRVSHALIADAADILEMAPLVYVLPGNHDLLENRLETARQQPIGLLSRLGNVVLIEEPRFVSPHPGVLVRAVPYHHTLDYSLLAWPMSASDAAREVKVLWIHQGVTRRPRPYPTYCTEDGDFPLDYDFVYAGHLHDRQEPWQVGVEGFGPTVYSPGALARGSLATHSIEHQPTVHLLEAGVMREIEVPIRPADEVFRLEDAARVSEAERVATEFLSELGKTEVLAVTAESVRDRIRNAPVDDSVKQRALAAIDEVWD